MSDTLQLAQDLAIAAFITLGVLVTLGLLAGWVYDQWLKWTGRPR